MSRDDRKRAIGKVVSVAADRFVVEMHAGTDNFTVVGFDDVHYVARLGSFLMIPVQTEYVVVEVVGLRERDVGSSGRKEGELDKAASAKYLDVVPVGMLPQERTAKFRFGVSVFPSLYADALYALDAELDRVFETDIPREPAPPVGTIPPTPADATRYRALTIGKSVVFDGYDVKVRIDDFFGGHTAVLGNTGSGKSCTVATVLQSLFEKADEYHARGATFIVFDVNGEYWQALSPLANGNGIDVARVILDGTATEGRFRLPHWFLEQSEWELLLQASERTQIPVLRTALGLTGLFRQKTGDALSIKEHFIATCIIECFRGADGDSPVTKFQRVVSLLQRYPTNDLNTDLLKSTAQTTNTVILSLAGIWSNFLKRYARSSAKTSSFLPTIAYRLRLMTLKNVSTSRSSMRKRTATGRFATIARRCLRASSRSKRDQNTNFCGTTCNRMMPAPRLGPFWSSFLG